MDLAPVAPLLIVVLLAAVSLWVLVDSRAYAARGTPVVATVVGFTIDKPEAWAALCLVAAMFVLPLYLVARRAT